MEQISSYAAPIATTLAALIVASNLGPRLTGLGFIIFTIGSVAWAILGLTTGQGNLLWQNVILTALNLFGVWRWLGWQARLEEGAVTAAKESRQQPSETLFPISLLTRGEVQSREGAQIGHCVDAMAGCRSGQLAYVVVAQGGVAGVGQTLRRLPWNGCLMDGEVLKSPMGRTMFSTLDPLEADIWPAR